MQGVLVLLFLLGIMFTHLLLVLDLVHTFLWVLVQVLRNIPLGLVLSTGAHDTACTFLLQLIFYY